MKILRTLLISCTLISALLISACGQQNGIYTTNMGTTDTDVSTEEPWVDFELPSYYCSTEHGETGSVKNQGLSGACWAYASTSALEASLLPDEEYVFSAEDMVNNSGFGLQGQAGGDYVMVMAYLARWDGPVIEEETDDEGRFDPETEKHVQEMQIIRSKSYDEIKQAVMKYGSVESSIYFAENEDQIDENYFNKYENSYCYPNEGSPNHQILIVGWDDDYPKEKFFTGAKENGAFICQNSWGEDFGNGGFFYISYSDYFIGMNNLVFTRIEDKDNFDNIYQYDICGWVGRMGFESPKAYFASVFESNGDETVEAVGFYSLGFDTSYEVYVCKEFTNTFSLDTQAKPCASGTIKNRGYYTISLDEPVNISAGNKFAVIVMVNSPGETHPVAVELKTGDDRSSMVTIEGKESYLSSNGENWERTQDTSECNICLKCFTNNR